MVTTLGEKSIGDDSAEDDGEKVIVKANISKHHILSGIFIALILLKIARRIVDDHKGKLRIILALTIPA